MPVYVDRKFVSMISCQLPLFKRKSEKLANFRCVFCGDSEKHKFKSRGYLYEKGTGWFFHCHNCQKSLSFGGLLKEIDPLLYSEYLLETFEDSHSARRQKAPTIITTTESMRFGTIQPVIYQNAEKISDLPPQHYCREYVKSRQIPEQFYNKLYYTAHYLDFLNEISPNHGKPIKDEARLVIPFYDRFGAICAVSGRALGNSELRYITVRTNDDESKLVYGLERVDQSQVVYITEGPLDSLFLDNAVASGDANLILTAARLTASQIVFVFDNEPRSYEIVKQMQRAIKLGHKIVIWPEWVKEKDINAMVLAGRSPKEIIKSCIYSGLTASLMMTHWKKTINNRGVLV